MELPYFAELFREESIAIAWWLVAVLLALCAIARSLYPFLAAAVALAILVGGGVLMVVLFPDGGLALAVLLIYYAIFCFVVLLGLLVFFLRKAHRKMQDGSLKPLGIPARVVLGLVGLGMACIVGYYSNYMEITRDRAVAIIQKGDAEAFKSLPPDFMNGWGAQKELALQPPTAERLAMLQAVVQKERRFNYDEELIRNLLTAPSSPVRTQYFALIANSPAFTAQLRDYLKLENQDDPEALAALHPILARLLSQSIAADRMDLLQAGLALAPYAAEKQIYPDDETLHPPFQEACRQDSLQAVALLIEAGASKKEINQGLYYASTPEILAVLLQNGADANFKLREKEVPGWDTEEPYSNPTALQSAFLLQSEKMALALLEAGANPEASDNYGRTALHYAAACQASTTVWERLQALPVNLDAQDVDGLTPMHWAAFAGNKSAVKYLLEAGAEYAVKNKEGYSPLFYALLGSHERGWSVLVKSFSPQELSLALRPGDGQKETIYQWIAGWGYSLPLPAFTQEAGLGIMAWRSTNYYAYVLAGKKAIIEMLLGKGAKVEVQDAKASLAERVFARVRYWDTYPNTSAYFPSPLLDHTEKFLRDRYWLGYSQPQWNARELHEETQRSILALLVAGKKADPLTLIPLDTKEEIETFCGFYKTAACEGAVEAYKQGQEAL